MAMNNSAKKPTENVTPPQKDKSNNVYIGPGGFNYQKVTPPRSLKDIPRYVKELLGGFFYRLFYIFELVWKT